MKTYQNVGVNLETKFSVEYVFDPRIISELEADTHPAPWELYETKQFDNLDDAISFFLPLYFNPKCYDPKLFIQILLDGEIVEESYLELNPTTIWSISKLIDRDRQEQLDQCKTALREQENLIADYRNVTRSLHEYDKIKWQYINKNPNSALRGEVW